jgi:hypothetical protein
VITLLNAARGESRAAHKLGFGLRTLDRAIASGQIKARKVGVCVLAPISEVERYLSETQDRPHKP